MAYYYVKSGGTATGDAGRAATKRTGSFATMGASAYYDNVFDVLGGAVPTTTCVSGDNILCASDHAEDYAAGGRIHTGGVGSLPISVISVDTANAENYLRGASEIVSAGTLTTRKNMRYIGIDIEARDFIECKSLSDFSYICEYDDCTLNYGRDNVVTYNLATGQGLVKNSKLTLPLGTLPLLSVSEVRGVVSRFSVVSVDASGGVGITKLFKADGGSFRVEDSDFSLLTAATELFTNLADTTPAGLQEQVAVRCKLPSGIAMSDAIGQHHNKVTVESCDVGDGYHYFYYADFYGVSDEDTSIYRTDGASYDGTNKFSAEMVANANADYFQPHQCRLSSQHVDTADYTTDITFTAHFAVDGSTTALTSDELWVEIEYTDGADNALGVIATTKADPLAAGTAPTTETALWTGLGGTNKQMSVSKTVTIGTTAGTIASGIVRVKAYIGKASQTVFVCPQVELS